MSVISYPIPAYSNVPINAQYYQPRRFVISAIALGQTTLITTSTNQDFAIGQLVRLIIPSPYGTTQLNGRQAYVVSIPSANQVELNIDSSLMNAFISASFFIQPQIIPIGDIATGQQNANGRTRNITYIPGSFINISPA